jgi:hypothetical protein
VGSELRESSSIKGDITVEVTIYNNGSTVAKIVNDDVVRVSNGLKNRLVSYFSLSGTPDYPTNLSRTLKSSDTKYPLYLTIVLMNSTLSAPINPNRPAPSIRHITETLYIPNFTADGFIRGIESFYNKVKESQHIGPLGHLTADTAHGDATLKIIREKDLVGYTITSDFDNEQSGMKYSGQEVVLYSIKGWLLKDSVKSVLENKLGTGQAEVRNKSEYNFNIVLCKSTAPDIRPLNNAPNRLGSWADTKTITLALGAGAAVAAAAVGIWYVRRSH